jgi:putative ABC transport system ATP-binding protein
LKEVIRLEDIKKTYRIGGINVPALQGVNLAVEEGAHISLMGPSGSGKTTLLNLLGCLDTPTSGRYLFEGDEISRMDDDQLSEIRSRRIGFVFQSYNLIPHLTVLENIGLPLFYQGKDERIITEKALELARTVGLSDRIKHRPAELSGGQQQRVAIARALANDPSILLTDEPTGNLDTKTGTEIMNLLKRLNEEGKTLFVITHDRKIAEWGKEIVGILDGVITEGNFIR